MCSVLRHVRPGKQRLPLHTSSFISLANKRCLHSMGTQERLRICIYTKIYIPTQKWDPRERRKEKGCTDTDTEQKKNRSHLLSTLVCMYVRLLLMLHYNNYHRKQERGRGHGHGRDAPRRTRRKRKGCVLRIKKGRGREKKYTVLFFFLVGRAEHATRDMQTIESDVRLEKDKGTKRVGRQRNVETKRWR